MSGPLLWLVPPAPLEFLDFWSTLELKVPAAAMDLFAFTMTQSPLLMALNHLNLGEKSLSSEQNWRSGKAICVPKPVKIFKQPPKHIYQRLYLTRLLIAASPPVLKPQVQPIVEPTRWKRPAHGSFKSASSWKTTGNHASKSDKQIWLEPKYEENK